MENCCKVKLIKWLMYLLLCKNGVLLTVLKYVSGTCKIERTVNKKKTQCGEIFKNIS